MASAAIFRPDRFQFWRDVELDLSQAELAKRLQYTRGMISRIENGTATPTARFWGIVARAFPGLDPRRKFFRARAGR